jgi:tetratricopeptide (TPR) repeat protein
MYYLGKVAASVEQLKQAENIAEALGDARRLGRALSFLTLHALISGRPSVVQIYAERTLTIAKEVEDVASRAMANYYLGHGRLVAGDLRRAIARFRDVALILEEAANKSALSPSSNLRAGAHRSYLAWCLAESGQFTEAIQLGLDAVHSAEASEVAHWLVQAWSTLTYVHTVRGEYPRAAELSERALALAKARELGLFLPLQQWLVGYTWARSGRVAEGLPLIRAGLAQLEAWELSRWLPLVILHLGEVCLLTGLIDEARAHAVRGLGLARELGQRLHEAYALRVLGEILSRDDAAGAEESYRAALAVADELGLRPLVAHCHLGFGRLYGRTTKRQEARERLTTATTMYRKMGMTYWREMAAAEMRLLA